MPSLALRLSHDVNIHELSTLPNVLTSVGPHADQRPYFSTELCAWVKHV